VSRALCILTIYRKGPTTQDSIAQRTEGEISASPRIDTQSTLSVGGGIRGLRRIVLDMCYKFYVLLIVHLYNLVNETNLVHYLFLATCFGPLQVHHQEEQLYLCDTWYLLFCIPDCLVCRSICSCIPDSQLYRITSTKCLNLHVL